MPTVTSLKKTSLNDLHTRSGARFIAFAGYEMPLQYEKGIIQEHLHCRNHAGLFDISHMGQCLVKGEAAAGELEKLCPGNITRLNNGQQQYTVFTNADGGTIDDIVITKFESHLAITVNAACKEKDFQHLQKHLSDRVQFQILNEHALLALQGPKAANILFNLVPEACELSFMHAFYTEIEGIRCMISRSGYTGEDGFEISVPNKHVNQLAELILNESDVELIGLGARDTLRMEAGLCLYGHELNETITPVEAGLNWIIHGNNRRFPGAGTILYQLQNGSELLRTGLIVNARTPVRENALLVDEQGSPLGHVTSGGFSPSLGKPIAMALINSDAAIIGSTVYAQVRNSPVELTVCDLPFVPRRYFRG
ncbi:glycine cleavage system aminomethyltransferase GcvT [Methylicorpusculum sp.]|uniref:glycine cleavage system aminomethyltransferase GcvT n=1 Tax=Methylicorpusculum sp. TaxID=2713644 RepID=UPI002727DA09|nr:glycine cleavage system aminomethyltransferase GcvT [Methylicorpusculum sp.]MDO8844657.1 glycine cleavage system aminomethyltransferase GcvT [Methylicorpusculum sp.]